MKRILAGLAVLTTAGCTPTERPTPHVSRPVKPLMTVRQSRIVHGVEIRTETTGRRMRTVVNVTENGIRIESTNSN
jgi:hypothetical protein